MTNEPTPMVTNREWQQLDTWGRLQRAAEIMVTANENRHPDYQGGLTPAQNHGHQLLREALKAVEHTATVQPVLPFLGVDFAITKKDEGDRLKEEGMAKALMKQGLEEWSADFDAAVRTLARTGTPFTAEDVVNVVGLPNESVPNGNNQVGARISAAAKKGIIRKTGVWLKTKRPSSHSRDIPEWVGTWEWRANNVG